MIIPSTFLPFSGKSSNTVVVAETLNCKNESTYILRKTRKKKKAFFFFIAQEIIIRLVQIGMHLLV